MRKIHAKKALALILALAVSLWAFAGCQAQQGGSEASGAGDSGEDQPVKTITLTVVHKDGSSKDFTIETGEEMLGPALMAEGLIEGSDGQYGLFITSVDGEAADDGNQEWWCLTKGGESVMTGVDSTPVEDGGKYELTLTVGY